MKKRDMIGLVIAVAVMAITGVLLYTQLAPAPKDTGINVVVPAKVKDPLSETKVPYVDPKDGKTKEISDAERMTELEVYTDYSAPQECTDSSCGRPDDDPPI
jgi:hypothetical protein